MIDQARIMRVLRLDWTVFREIATDETATTKAATIVVLVSLLSAIGTFLSRLIHGFGIGNAFGGFFYGLIVSGILLGWIGWAVLTYFVGTALFGGKTTIPEMLRVLGYAFVPRVLGFFSFIPILGGIISWIGAVLALIAGVLAIREAMEFDTVKAILTVVISWVIIIVISVILGIVAGIGSFAAGVL